jgi:hypothetical protein
MAARRFGAALASVVLPSLDPNLYVLVERKVISHGLPRAAASGAFLKRNMLRNILRNIF